MVSSSQPRMSSTEVHWLKINGLLPRFCSTRPQRACQPGQPLYGCLGPVLHSSQPKMPSTATMWPQPAGRPSALSWPQETEGSVDHSNLCAVSCPEVCVRSGGPQQTVQPSRLLASLLP